jgi:hypothetical protein
MVVFKARHRASVFSLPPGSPLSIGAMQRGISRHGFVVKTAAPRRGKVLWVLMPGVQDRMGKRRTEDGRFVSFDPDRARRGKQAAGPLGWPGAPVPHVDRDNLFMFLDTFAERLTAHHPQAAAASGLTFRRRPAGPRNDSPASSVASSALLPLPSLPASPTSSVSSTDSRLQVPSIDWDQLPPPAV